MYCNAIVKGYFSITFSYEVGGVTLPLATNHPYLGPEISFHLSWDLQIAAITKKANQILAILRRNLGNCPVKEKEKGPLYPCYGPFTICL